MTIAEENPVKQLTIAELLNRGWQQASRKLRAIAGLGCGYHQVICMTNHRDLDAIKAMVEKGALKPAVDRTFDGLAQAAEAMAYSAAGRATGKVAVRVG